MEINELILKNQKLEQDNEQLKSEIDKLSIELVKLENNLMKERIKNKQKERSFLLFQILNKALITTKNKQEILSQIVMFMVEKIGYDRAVIFKKVNHDYVPAAHYGYSDQENCFEKLMNPFFAVDIDTTSGIIINSASEIDSKLIINNNLEVKYLLAVPFKVNEIEKYILFIGNKKEESMRRQTITLMDLEHFKILSGQIAIALENIGLYETLENKVKERTRELESKNEELSHLSMHDGLTGLFNRTYFENRIKQLNGLAGVTIGTFICDIDGLKLINDTLGHSTGDQLLRNTANILKRCFRKNDLLARIGGDEFVAIVTNVSPKGIVKTYNRLCNEIGKYNNKSSGIRLSLSIGYADNTKSDLNIYDLIREADLVMYREKFKQSKNVRNALVQAFISLLGERDFINEGHSDRLEELVVNIGEAICLPLDSINNLRLLAQFHDIGKIGIPDHIVFKPDSLTKEEYKIMQAHAEIGFKIAQSSPQLIPIADFILKHHEWWNGQGYPIGLKEEEIPIECRILAIVDAYDAITNDRPYRKSRDKDCALNEIKKNSGTKFDPLLVEIFITQITKKSPK